MIADTHAHLFAVQHLPHHNLLILAGMVAGVVDKIINHPADFQLISLHPDAAVLLQTDLVILTQQLLIALHRPLENIGQTEHLQVQLHLPGLHP